VPSYSVSEQRFVDRLVGRVRWQFRFVPAWGFWLEYREGFWQAWAAEENLREQYLLTLEEVVGDEKLDPSHRARAAAFSSQNWALWALRRDTRLIAAPWQFESPEGFPLFPPPTLGQTDRWPSLASILSNSPLATVSAFCGWFASRTARAGGGTVLGSGPEVLTDPSQQASPCCLLRHSADSPDLGDLHDSLAQMLAGRVVRLGPKTWAAFPECVTPSLAYQLTGAMVVFLEGVENSKRFPQAALRRWLTWSAANYEGKDGERYSLAMPPYYVMAGPPVRFNTIEKETRPYLLRADKERVH
jgi:hypothetical protein